MTVSVPGHWPEYLAEAWGLAFFMLSAAAFGVLLFHPASPASAILPSTFARRALMGLAMGLTALVNVHSPWGRRSGCHLNPALTLTFLQLGKVQPRDAYWYVTAQFLGGAFGALGSVLLLRMWLSHPAVNYVVTVPGPYGHVPAFAAELVLSMMLVYLVLAVSSRPRWARCTGVVVAAFIGLAITFESPLSGMSLNPARTVASALAAGRWEGLWIYFVAPVLGMLLGAAAFVRVRGRDPFCAKLDHDQRVRCIFCDHIAGAEMIRGNPAGPAGISASQPQLET